MENFNFEAKAKAIWKALDDMAENDPEMYKQFINDQLNGDGMKDMFKNLNLGTESASEMTANNTTKKSTLGSTETKSHGKGQTMSNSTSSCSGSGQSKKRSVNTVNCKGKRSATGMEASSNENNSNSLLDDTFSRLKSHSLLAQIVADDAEDGDLLLTEIKLPVLEEGNGDGQPKTAKKKVLIEEL